MSLNNKIEKSDLARDALYDKVNVIAEELDEKKQELLIAGENIKTINGESIVGSGNVEISGLNRNITNCITEIPQDIKLELNDGTLTLKAGSKVYVPNGADKFDEVVIASDISATRTDSQDCIAWYNTNTGTMQLFPAILFYSGSTAPSVYQYMFWYDTANNKCKITNDNGATWVEGKSFPLCIVSMDGNQITSIDQVFNGFGYIGSTVFALPGVKGLIPNGRNEDGSLNNIEYTINKVLVKDVSTRQQDDYFFIDTNNWFSNWSKLDYFVDNYPTPRTSKWYLVYDTQKNRFYISDDGGDYYIKQICILGEYGKGLSYFQPKLPFRAVDKQEVVSYINNKFQLVSALPANPDSNTFYFIPE